MIKIKWLALILIGLSVNAKAYDVLRAIQRSV